MLVLGVWMGTGLMWQPSLVVSASGWRVMGHRSGRLVRGSSVSGEAVHGSDQDVLHPKRC